MKQDCLPFNVTPTLIHTQTLDYVDSTPGNPQMNRPVIIPLEKYNQYTWFLIGFKYASGYNWLSQSNIIRKDMPQYVVFVDTYKPDPTKYYTHVWLYNCDSNGKPTNQWRYGRISSNRPAQVLMVYGLI